MKYKNTDKIIKEIEHINKDGSALPLLEFEKLRELPNVKHCFTTRDGGVSKGIYSSLNLSFTRGDDDALVMENYQRVADAFGVSLSDIVTSDQTHTTNVRVVTKEDAGKGITKLRDYTDVDGLITNETDILLATFYADCVPLYFVDPIKHVIGLSHSGWKGTVNRMGKVTIEKMQEVFSCEPNDIYCAIGPSICQDCYEVSSDVADAFADEFKGQKEEILLPKPEGKYQLDLWKANEIVLLEAGILPEHLAITNVCTCCNDKQLFSHRASKGMRGNLGAFLMQTSEK